jgi:hypothetical protein
LEDEETDEDADFAGGDDDEDDDYVVEDADEDEEADASFVTARSRPADDDEEFGVRPKRRRVAPKKVDEE